MDRRASINYMEGRKSLVLVGIRTPGPSNRSVIAISTFPLCQIFCCYETVTMYIRYDLPVAVSVHRRQP